MAKPEPGAGADGDAGGARRTDRELSIKSELMAKIRMYTTSWCPDCHRAKRFLSERGIEVEEINIEEVEGAADTVVAQNGGKRKVPTFEVDGRFFTCSPYNPELLRRELGLRN